MTLTETKAVYEYFPTGDNHARLETEGLHSKRVGKESLAQIQPRHREPDLTAENNVKNHSLRS